MTFWKNISDNIVKGARSVSEDLKQAKEILIKKKEFLSKFKLTDLVKICDEYGVQKPNDSYIDFISGKNIKKEVSRDEYIEKIIFNLNLEQIEKFSIENKIINNDFVLKSTQKCNDKLIHNNSKNKQGSLTQPEDQNGLNYDALNVESNEIIKPLAVSNFSKNEDENLDLILTYIKTKFQPKPVKNEKDFENQLFQKLDTVFENQAQTQVKTMHGPIDIVIANKYALELKLATSVKNLRDMLSQVLFYKRVYPNIAIVIMDTGDIDKDVINNFVLEYKKELNVKAIVIPGKLKRNTKR
jgi:hypothetical protein